VYSKWQLDVNHLRRAHGRLINILTACSILQQLGVAMQQLHAIQQVHNDLKDFNLLADGLLVSGALLWRVGLTDLGVAVKIAAYIDRLTGTQRYNGMVLTSTQLQQLQMVLRDQGHICKHVSQFAQGHTAFDLFGFAEVGPRLLETADETHASQQAAAWEAAAAEVQAVMAAAVRVYEHCQPQIQQLKQELASIKEIIPEFALAHAMYLACFILRKQTQYEAPAGAVYCSAAEQVEGDALEQHYMALSLQQLADVLKSATAPMQPQDMVRLKPLVTAVKQKALDCQAAVTQLLAGIISATPDDVMRRSLQELGKCRVPQGEEYSV
jgi:hypothetical protein